VRSETSKCCAIPITYYSVAQELGKNFIGVLYACLGAFLVYIKHEMTIRGDQLEIGTWLWA